MTWLRDIDRWFIDRVFAQRSAHRRFARHLLGDVDDAEEVVQEVYARLFALDDWQRIADPHAFAMRMIRNIAIERFRRADVVRIDRATVLHTLDLADDQPQPDQIAMDRAELRRVADAMTALPPRSREALHLRRVEGLPPRRVAEIMGIAVSTVEKHLVKGLRSLHEALRLAPDQEVGLEQACDPIRQEER
jgi:RNA polymerase sigma factor (sigma-70 family)